MKNIFLSTILAMALLAGCESKYSDTPTARTKDKESIMRTPMNGYGARSFAMGDIDNDGLDDILTSDNNGYVYFHKNMGGNRYVKWSKPVFKISKNGYGTRSFAVGDYDGDGYDDILSSDNKGYVYVHKNLKDLRFAE